jgi:peptide methionine sulfoxide reductase MsrA
VQSPEEKKIAIDFLKDLEDSDKFDDKIVVVVEYFSAFYKAEEYHQDFNQKNSDYYERYKKGS